MAPDILAFLDLRKNHGKEELRARLVLRTVDSGLVHGAC